MKRIFIVAVSSSALALAAPAIASAHHHHSAKRHHKHHVARARVLDFRASAPATSAPTSPTTPTTESVGKIASFKEGVLTITLTDGTQVSGKVTEQTEIQCPSTATPSTNDGDDDDQGSGDDQGGSGDDQGGSSLAHESSNGDEGGGSDQQQSCTTAALTEGALVREAELVLTSTGAVWEKVDLA